VKEELEINEDCLFIFFGDDPKDRTFRRFREFSFTMKQARFFHTLDPAAQVVLGLRKTD
jgi:hypothetical protein